MRLLNANKEDGIAFIDKLINRFQSFPEKYEESVREIIKEVKARGDEALVDYTRNFDCPSFTRKDLEVSLEEVERAYDQIDTELLQAIRLAIANVKDFHKKQKERSWIETRPAGAVVGQLVRPVERAGLYVPGGTGGETPLISTVIMTAVPAKVAGVEEVVMVSPPNKEGRLHPALLVAAKEAGINCIFKIGSAWAIAALAFGTASVPRVDVICGPGNIYVTLAKKILAGEVGIDMIAGPSEILIIADESANPAWLAADLLSQAEHDTLATAVMLTPSEKLAKETTKEVKKQLKKLPRKEVAEKALEEYGAILLVKDLSQASELANHIAPEHLELCVKDPWSFLAKIKHAGAVFLGHFTPEAVGDYIAGANHVLPTMGCARYAQALGVHVFQKRLSVVAYSYEALSEEGRAVIKLAETEGLSAHANSVKIRLKK
ncbi:histidinol dehydrogenase [Thermodesulfatator autotrophicus]|uniref:Histidinol dehydrogenase n=1 Tax=Thermodesulfatator autotrophicus TaxID=1795632 RepID=A0A177E582_9BACT|nr:histidinol dehydrogenase [Thermodesulfatator autotrophicus]OAG26938.1 histidinol dehydrogenase [Thermodesulfatator autotrophicus]